MQLCIVSLIFHNIVLCTWKSEVIQIASQIISRLCQSSGGLLIITIDFRSLTPVLLSRGRTTINKDNVVSRKFSLRPLKSQTCKRYLIESIYHYPCNGHTRCKKYVQRFSRIGLLQDLTTKISQVWLRRLNGNTRIYFESCTKCFFLIYCILLSIGG